MALCNQLIALFVYLLIIIFIYLNKRICGYEKNTLLSILILYIFYIILNLVPDIKKKY